MEDEDVADVLAPGTRFISCIRSGGICGGGVCPAALSALQVDMVEVTEWEKSVWLPFKTTVCLPDDVTVEWKHKDRTIFVYQRSQNQHLLQDQVYRGRTEMKEEPLRTGDFSLKLNNLQLTDHGVYICTVYNKSKKLLRQKVVTLSVRDRQVEMVEVADWEKNVKLSFTTTDDLPQDVTVEWRRSDSKQMMVYMYPGDQNQGDDQDQFYRGRTEMNMEPLQTKDLSLTLKDVQLADRGVYTCTVYNKDRKILLQKSVSLSVRVAQLQVVVLTEGVDFVWLPFKTTDDLHEHIKVEWRHQNMKIHEYQSGQNQASSPVRDYKGRTEMIEEEVNKGDFSLVLKQPKLEDCGVYTCTVKNRDGKILRDKIIALGVQGSLKRGNTDLDYIMRHVVSSSHPLVSSTETIMMKMILQLDGSEELRDVEKTLWLCPNPATAHFGVCTVRVLGTARTRKYEKCGSERLVKWDGLAFVALLRLPSNHDTNCEKRFIQLV